MIKYINGVMNAPEAVGSYSQAVICENIVYLSGQIPILPDNGELVEGGIEEQTNQVMKNLLAVLGHMQLDFSNILKTTIYLTNVKDFHIVNSVYTKWIGGVRPARSTVQVAALPRGAMVEMDMIAFLTAPEVAMMPMPSVENLKDLPKDSFTVSKGPEMKGN